MLLACTMSAIACDRPRCSGAIGCPRRVAVFERFTSRPACRSARGKARGGLRAARRWDEDLERCRPRPRRVLRRGAAVRSSRAAAIGIAAVVVLLVGPGLCAAASIAVLSAGRWMAIPRGDAGLHPIPPHCHSSSSRWDTNALAINYRPWCLAQPGFSAAIARAHGGRAALHARRRVSDHRPRHDRCARAPARRASATFASRCRAPATWCRYRFSFQADDN